MRRLLLVLLASVLLVILASGCTEVQTMNLSTAYENITQENISYVSDKDSSVPEMISNITGPSEETDGEAPLAIEEPALIYIDPEKLVRKLCPEQVLLGLRKCRFAGNDLNITIKNAGFRNITMIFYMLFENEEISYVYSDEPFITKEEKTYTIDFGTLEGKYGEIDKIEATPVLVEGLEAISCQNKKLPILVSSGCS
ncbi:MAG TPA: hypothetical protein VJC00_03035 [Candidatus Nanoarchaeia archaeon]|nr:hypothetical protein [Candidatus Nanoarchaeia archaeon]